MCNKIDMLLRLTIVWFISIVETLLIIRFVLRLLAARPDHPVVSSVYAITTPLIQPFAALDSGQPQFGAMLELSTLVLILVIGMSILGVVYIKQTRI
ncbi:MAG: hypothetical protein GFH24_608298n67 [Chloroflexi bacterium AL-N5]|nr:hypothetical protein [Chloroflexi bacterium AL-N5]